MSIEWTTVPVLAIIFVATLIRSAFGFGEALVAVPLLALLKSWGPVRSFGFKGHSPYFLRHSSGVVLLAHRLPATSLQWSSDDGKTWNGPVKIDTVGGAYPSMVELPDGLVYCVYYEEGKGSSIRGVRLRVDAKGVKVVRKQE
jgi:hypothetical protein